MQMTAAVINAGLGDLSLGLEMAGIKVVAAYETDKGMAVIHRNNFDAPVFPLPLKIDEVKTIPRVDILAGRLYQQPRTHSKFIAREASTTGISGFLTLLDDQRPRAFFLTFRSAFLKEEPKQSFLSSAVERGYRCAYRIFNIMKETGSPVTEHIGVIVGVKWGECAFEFPEERFSAPLPPEDFLQIEESVAPWYFDLKKMEQESMLPHRNGKRFYCWKSHAYEGVDLVGWNYWKIPLIDTGDRFRKMTHREIANLKGLPASYNLPDHKNRSWLYQKLMYAVNVQVTRQIADRLIRSLSDAPIRERQISQEEQFENLFARYLAELADKSDIKWSAPNHNLGCDFMLQAKGQVLYFELKCYRGRYARLPGIEKICDRFSRLSGNGKPVLVFANEVPESIRAKCWREYQVSIWDVQNLLWLFGEYGYIKNEFIALLDYTISDIEPQPPNPNVLQEMLEYPPKSILEVDPEITGEPLSRMAAEADADAKKETIKWEDRLRHIKPGLEQFQEYEQFCVDILKYTLGEYLTLWQRQERTDDSLHRFDLCCKIKSGRQEDFFDIITHYFHTKHIVFEFKNYGDKISQKEIYTTEKYLYRTALRKTAIIISRRGSDDHALQAAKGSLRENGKLILCLSDLDLLKMADIKAQGEKEPADFLSEMLDRLLIHLEK